MSAPKASVESYLKRLRWRAYIFVGARALALAFGVGALLFALGAAAMGPLGGLAGAIPIWLVIAIGAGTALFVSLRPIRALRGGGAASLLSSVEGRLASETRSAYELGLGQNPGLDGSEELIRAHRARVERLLSMVPPRRAVSWRWLGHPILAGGLGMLGLALGLFGASDRVSSGAYALLHPGERDDTGEQVAALFTDVRARLLFPPYLDRPAIEVRDPRILEVPAGTTLEISGRSTIPTRDARLLFGAATVRLAAQPDGRLLGRLVVREDGSLILKARDERGRWIRDASIRRVMAVADEAPRVSLLSPIEDATVELEEALRVEWDAADEVGLAEVELVLKVNGGEPVRRSLARYEGAGRTHADGNSPLDLARLGAQPGDEVEVWVEAHDTDSVRGPNLGSSERRRLTIASPASRRAERLADLEEVLDQGLDALADRLENEVPDEEEGARTRFELVSGSLSAFGLGLESLVEASPSGAEQRGILSSMAERVQRQKGREAALHGRSLAAKARRERMDTDISEELESDILRLSDLMGQARLEDAAEIARELESLRRQIHSLLQELRRTRSPAARTALLEAIGRAQARMAELAQRIANMSDQVPGEFLNPGAMGDAQQSREDLGSLREAVERGDLEEAERLAEGLRAQIDAMARALGGAEESFSESRFGPRQRAMADAMDTLGGIEAEQQALARRGAERRAETARRALEASRGRNGEAAERLAEEAQAVRQALQRMESGGLGGYEQDARERTEARLRDTHDALEAGDLGEARAMAERAGEALAGLSRDLDLSTLMFPGHNGEVAENASRARAALDRLRNLRRRIDQAIPDVGAHIDPQHRTEMRHDRQRQQEARQAADRLAEAFAAEPDGAPLSPESADAMREIGEVMQEAQQGLGRSDPMGSSHRQEEAARRLTELRERLEQDQRSSSGGGGGSEGSRDFDPRREVHIHGADEFQASMEQRRRLLDAMGRSSPPQGYEEAVRSYYEGLLR